MKSFLTSSLALAVLSVLAIGCDSETSLPSGASSQPSAQEALAVAGSSGSEVKSTNRNFRAHLSGREEVPERDTKAQGQAILQLSKDGTELRFKVNVANIDNVIGIHIHLAPVGENGPIVLPLLGTFFIPDPGLTVNGTIVEGTATAADLTGPLASQSLEDLVEQMRAGMTYANVHTVEFRPGEIRGQIH